MSSATDQEALARFVADVKDCIDAIATSPLDPKLRIDELMQLAQHAKNRAFQLEADIG